MITAGARCLAGARFFRDTMNKRSKASFVDPLLRTGASACALVNSGNDVVLAHTLIAAFDSKSRRQGLLRHDSLPDSSAIIIAPSNAIHTFFMRFAIDVAFVARDGRVVKVSRAVRPWRIAAALRAFAAIELPAGALDRAGIAAGDTLRVTRLSPIGVPSLTSGQG
jgi:hypothetical protein